MVLWGLWTGLDVDLARVETDALAVFNLDPPPEPPPPPKPEVKREVVKPAPKPIADPEPEGGASADNLRSRAAPVVAPDLPRPPLIPALFPAAPVPANGADATSGASDRPGPGTGVGGVGDGLGSGRGGDGTGGGGGGTVPALDAVKISGEITRKDYPRKARRYLEPRSVFIAYTVLPSGRVSGCEVFRSSGDAILDETTCRLATQRFRYQPARDRYGRAVPSEEGWKQDWWAVVPEDRDRPADYGSGTP